MKKEVLHEKLEFSDMRDLVERAGEMYGERNAYSFRRTPRSEITTVTFHQFREDVRALTTEMLSHGCTGKHCCVLGKPSYEWAVIYFSVQAAGAVLVPLDSEWNADDLADTMRNANISFLFCDGDLKEKAEELAVRLSLEEAPVFMNTSELPNSLTDWIAAGKEKFDASSEAYYATEIDPDKLSLLVFTSGTTGKGKGVMLSQSAVLTDMSDIIPYIDFGIKTVGVLPLYHTYGSSVMLVGHAIIGSEIYISAGLRYVQKELKEQKPGHLVIVPLYLETFYRKIQANIKEQGKTELVNKMIRFSNKMRKVGIDLRPKLFGAIRAAFGGEVKMIISGGAPVNPEILHFFESIGISTLNGYGITECAPIIAVNRSRRSVPGSVGPVLDIDAIRIDDPNEDGEGEICVKGPNVMLGYYNNEAATAEAIDEEGFFHTGDYGKLDENNVLYITGRKKNLIILSNGKNVYPEEIENELVAVPGVQDIIVYEGKSKRGENFNSIVAEIYPDKEYIEKNGITDIKAHLQTYVENYNKTAVPYKKIGVLKVRETEFPKNNLRKIQRFQLDTDIE